MNFSKLPLINNTYPCRRQSNRFKWCMIFVHLPINSSLTKNNDTNLGL